MMFLVDSAKREDFRRVRQLGFDPAGVTLNPTLVRKAGFASMRAAVSSIAMEVPDDGAIFCQVMGDTAEELVRNAGQLAARDPRVVVKIEATWMGFEAMRVCRELDFETAATMVYRFGQGVLAWRAGADYLLPFVNMVEQRDWDGLGLVEDLARLPAAVLAVSVKTPEQFRWALCSECWGLSAPASTYELVAAEMDNEGTAEHWASFKTDWDQLEA